MRKTEVLRFLLLAASLLFLVLGAAGCLQTEEQKVSTAIDGFMKAILEGKMRDAQKYVVLSQRDNRPEYNVNLEEASAVFGAVSELLDIPNVFRIGQSLLKIVQYDGVKEVRLEADGTATATATTSIFGQKSFWVFKLVKEEGEWRIFDLDTK